MRRPANPFSRRFPGWQIGRLRIWPWVGFWEVKRFRMGTTLILHVGYAVVSVSHIFRYMSGIVGRWLDEIDSRIEREVKGGNHGA